MSADWWLIQTMLLVDVAVIVLVWATLYWTFPRRISEGIKRNEIRLNGTISKRRRAREKEAGFVWLGNVLTVGMVCLLFVNGIVFAFHRFVMPFPVAANALDQFDSDLKVWRSNISDPEHGNVAQEFKDWQTVQGREDSAASLARLMPVYFAWIGLGVLAVLGMMAALGRAYVRSLVRFEADANLRHEAYLLCDMESRLRSIEKAKEPFAM